MMPFIGQDWRAPGETWIKTTEGCWERMKLRPIQISSEPMQIVSKERGRMYRESIGPSLFSDDENCSHGNCQDEPITEEVELNVIEDDWRPFCFVKRGQAKEFVGCTSMSEAFHRLNIARAVTNVRRFNYICKVVQILVRDKLQNLSGSARKILLSTVEAMVLHCLDIDSQLSTARNLVQDFVSGLDDGFHCGSPKLLVQHRGTVSDLYDLLTVDPPASPAESNEDSLTFLDLPRECLRAVLLRLPDHLALLEASQTHEALEALVDGEQRLWRGLCRFHFIPEQEEQIGHPRGSWRHTFFELKKYFGLRDVYADMIHICCHCKALFWKDLGHPCVSVESPSVRIIPQQFVDMLLLL